MGCEDLIGRLLLLHPLFERGNSIEDIRSFTAATMPHTGHHEQSITVSKFCAPGRRLLDALIVLDAVPWRNLRVTPAVILNQLPTTVEERLHVWIECVDRLGVGILGQREVGSCIESPDLPRGIFEHKIPELIEGRRSRRHCPTHRGPAKLAATLQPSSL